DKDKYSLTSGLQALVSYANNQNLPLPSGLDTIGFYLDSVTVSITPELPPTIDMIGFRLASAPGKGWTAPILGLGISDLFVQWQVTSPFSDPGMVGIVGGTLLLGSGASTSRIDVIVNLSGIMTPSALDVGINADLDPKYPVHIASLFEHFTGLQLDLDLTISDLHLEAHTGPRTLQFTAIVDGKWPFPVPLIEFGQTLFYFLYTPNSMSGSVSVRVAIASFDFLVSAAASTGEGWQFAGQLATDTQGRTLQDFVNSVTSNQYPTLPGNLGAISLEKLDVSVQCKHRSFLL